LEEVLNFILEEILSLKAEEIEKLPLEFQEEIRSLQEKIRSAIANPLIRSCIYYCRGLQSSAADEIISYQGEISPPLRELIKKIAERFIVESIGWEHGFGSSAIRKVNQLLKKIDENLSQFPWKSMFLARVAKRVKILGGEPKKWVKEVIEEAKQAGIDEKEMREALQKGLENREKEEISLETLELREALGMTISEEYLEELLKKGDSLLSRGWIELGIEIYKKLKDRIDIGKERKRLIDKFDELGGGKMDVDEEFEFKKFAEKIGIHIGHIMEG
jgi:uncharacterized protein (UPF0335 family)